MRNVERAIFLFSSTLFRSALGEDCYYANGTVVPPQIENLPCPNAPVTSMCCALNRTNPPGGDTANGWPRDECLPNGLCQNRVVNKGVPATAYWLNFCTDKDVTSSKCLDICRETRNSGGGSLMTPCDGTNNSTRWCCGSSTTCCTNNYGVVELPQLFVGNVISSASSTSTSTPAPTTSTSSSVTATKPEQTTAGGLSTSSPDSAGLSAGAKAGIGVGAALGALAVIGAVFFVRKALLWRKKSSFQESDGSAGYYHGSELYASEKFRAHAASNEISEMPHWGLVGELPTPPQPAELPGTGRVAEVR